MIQTIALKDIHAAEELIFSKAGVFDEDRRTFIQSLDTIDLQAAPGSGKTTALIAKLAVLEKYLPFEHNKGILVVSHTNTAVEEIKEKLEKHCPKLFAYPNFIGTIQSFVDQFLAGPYYTLRNKKKIYRIDDEAYEEALEKNLRSVLPKKRYATLQKIRQLYKANPDLIKESRLRYLDGQVVVCDSIDGEPVNPKKPRSKIDYTVEEKHLVSDYLFSLKSKILSDGVLCYDDAYFLADQYLRRYPKVIQLLRKRFACVFIDEMQDMSSYQIAIMDRIFYQPDNLAYTFQRIGDKNQSIYSDRSVDGWNTAGRKPMTLAGSKRFHPSIASFVKPFGIEFIDIKGNEEIVDCRPIMLLYDDDSIQQVIPYFPKLISKEAKEQKIVIDEKARLKAIAWRKDADKEVVTLKSYYSDYALEGNTQRHDFRNLLSYISQNFPPEKGLAEIRKAILNALLKLCRIESIILSGQRYFTKAQLISFLKTKASYPAFLEKLYAWCTLVYKHKPSEAHQDMIAWVPGFLKDIFGHDQLNENGLMFLKDNTIDYPITEEQKQKLNEYCCNETGLRVEIGTVHSVKGETHFATMYMECFYQSKHESERLIEQLLGNNFNHQQVYHKAAARMMYVGLSRPRQFLVFACHHDHVKEHLELLAKRWKVDTELIKNMS